MRPLDDIRVIAIEQYGAGPFGTMHLADLGADVIKIEDPASGGDVGRYVPPFQDGEDSLFYEAFNRNKRSLSLDLRNPAGRRVFDDLVVGADAVYSNLRGDVPPRLGITHADLAHLNPAIVCVSLSAYGSEGGRSSQPGYDYIIQGLMGWMSITGEPDGPPTKSGLSLVDFCGGMVSAFTLVSAIHAARRDGVGMDCDLSLFDVAASLLTYDAAWHLNGGWEPARRERSAHPSLVPFQLFQGGDGRWFVVACAKDKFWQRLTVAIDAPELAADTRLADFAGRDRHRDDVVSALDEIFATAPASKWIAVLEAAGVPVGPVNSVAEALAHEHTAARDLVVETAHPRHGRLRTMRSAARIGSDPPVHAPAPARNEHGSAILEELGYTDELVAELTTGGAFG